MQRIVMKSKIHNANVTETNLNYEGSITIDSTLLKETDIFPGERVQIVNLNNASRIETYVIEGEANSGVICMNGGTAHYAKPGDKVLIISYCLLDSKEAATFTRKVIRLDEKNKSIKNDGIHGKRRFKV